MIGSVRLRRARQKVVSMFERLRGALQDGGLAGGRGGGERADRVAQIVEEGVVAAEARRAEDGQRPEQFRYRGYVGVGHGSSPDGPREAARAAVAAGVAAGVAATSAVPPDQRRAAARALILRAGAMSLNARLDAVLDAYDCASPEGRRALFGALAQDWACETWTRQRETGRAPLPP